MPVTLKIAVDELIYAANTGFALTGGLSAAAANVIDEFGTEESKALYLEKIYSGRWSASMCLTEPGAGSALGSLRTQAVKIDGTADRYKIEGGKIFISMGDHDLTENIVHLVLAKTPGAPSGTRGISLFIVPKFKVNPDGSLGAHNDVVCTRIEHKMGIKASATCQLAFGDNGSCEGILIGKENHGLPYMFRMMNEERIAVGLQGMALASAAFLYARRYAAERKQGAHWMRRRDKEADDVAIIEHPDIRRMLWWMKSHVDGMRALLLTTSYFTDMSYAHPDEDERRRFGGFVELLTPICKAFCTDRGFDATILGIQCLGGYGYTSEYEAEQFARDAKIGSIYEGTNYIQAQDFIGRKVPMNGGQVLMAYLDVIEEDLKKAEADAELADLAKKVRDAKAETERAVVHLAGMEKDNELGFQTFLHATDAVSMMGDLCVAHLLTTQASSPHKKLPPPAALT
ncbi:MAG: acyl-CoA dehydrogenase family protein [Deltaproteobacteria bacterium]|nr:acyl-CoA dehydrogenase family protein [Deltaproteobacteria bacterium]